MCKNSFVSATRCWVACDLSRFCNRQDALPTFDEGNYPAHRIHFSSAPHYRASSKMGSCNSICKWNFHLAPARCKPRVHGDAVLQPQV
jgi:hypothetical protein